ncbi:Hercynylcysteine sulfoxide lyase [Cladobotryum mycophilum]|uniref:Hercynylcysteine sulfoxide lyase n=1 Tax=Cladobotryum mycophilum TaxID=491253 RepID=A0ABR0SXK9_9HYPO
MGSIEKTVLPTRANELAEDGTQVKVKSIQEFGGGLKSEFSFDPTWVNLNHGSFGGIPKAIRTKLYEYQDHVQARPDVALRYSYPGLTDESRAAVAEIIHAPVETVAFVTNATEAVNTVFRNLEWAEDGKDVIVYFSTIYESCGNMIDYVVDYFGLGRVSSKMIPIEYPLEDDEIISLFREAVEEIESQGKRARVCVFDVVSSRPGVVFPWVEMVKTCKELGVLSLVDGAQGIGMVHLDVGAADPDFFTSNCHKWLYTPVGCAVFYVPVRNHHLLPTTLSTCYGYMPKQQRLTRSLPPPGGKGDFASNFEFVGTKDYSPWWCVKDAVAYRRDVLGGEGKILDYLWDLNKKGSQYVADALGTYVLNNKAGTLTDCAMANIALPVWIGEKGRGAKEGDVVIPAEHRDTLYYWALKTVHEDYKTFLPMFWLHERLWIRTSAQVYLDMKDYEFAFETVKALCERIGKGEYLNGA